MPAVHPFAAFASVQLTPVACINAPSLSLTCETAAVLFFADATGTASGADGAADWPAVQAPSASNKLDSAALRKAGNVRKK
ncbi:conserved hypothetical protein [Xanthomonas phaseoli pv. phaseoli]|uniref:Secreted protein n=1 Tax=Xanthomonas campestris pv. phaseoli TaxID=317013 RepID=A0AB38E2K8_XANCH|nr:conserved hypothetical protein [Xanthomonas phaseoli pv. phaseoli]SON86226.1 conserved hypothetical protein [Xanthomonas phaseoli pv. phaseoli]SON90526.1 conserved hypothetical protein [Xanthomonas phaseoli pv. phaseoli]